MLQPRTIAKDSTHFNKHSRAMGFRDKKSYNRAAQDFAKKYQDHPDAKVYEGKWSARGKFQKETQRVITHNGKTVIVDPTTGQIIDFYEGTDFRGLNDLKPIR